MKLKKGMYIRTEDGRICKILKLNEPFEDDGYLDHNDIGSASIQEKNVIKASFNIIDLIEVGDYVNGYKIDYTNLKCETPFLRSNQPYRVDNTLYSELIKKGKDYNQPLHFYNDDIKSILTKEQFNSCKYVVERDK